MVFFFSNYLSLPIRFEGRLELLAASVSDKSLPSYEVIQIVTTQNYVRKFHYTILADDEFPLL